MSAVSSPYGLVPIYDPTGMRVPIFTQTNAIPSGYATSIYTNQAITQLSTGYIAAAGTSDTIIGTFLGCSYIDTTGTPRQSLTWPASTLVLSGTYVTATYTYAPTTVYRIQANGSVAQTAIGDQANLVNPTNNSNGASTAQLNSSLVGVGNNGQFRIVGLDLNVYNAWGDAYTDVWVQIANHPYVATRVAI